MLADQANGAGLRALLALFLNETNLGADAQAIKGPIEDSVAVKIDFCLTRILPGLSVLLVLQQIIDRSARVTALNSAPN